MMGAKTLKWTAYIAGGAMAVAFILPFVEQRSGTDADGNDWQVTTGINPVTQLARDSARRTYPHFIEALERAGAGAEGFEVEVELRSKRGVATVVWLNDISITSDDMSGTLTVTPPDGLRAGLKKGDTTSFTRYQVGDWKYPDNERWRGHYVLRVSLSDFSEQDRAATLQRLHERPVP